MLFDFHSYLKTIDPINLYDIQPLTGGIINVTVRATKVTDHDHDDRSKFPGRKSIVLKHATPYIAAVGPNAPFDVFRQVGRRFHTQRDSHSV